jgi:hypothetical protein
MSNSESADDRPATRPSWKSSHLRSILRFAITCYVEFHIREEKQVFVDVSTGHAADVEGPHQQVVGSEEALVATG